MYKKYKMFLIHCIRYWLLVCIVAKAPIQSPVAICAVSAVALAQKVSFIHPKGKNGDKTTTYTYIYYIFYYSGKVVCCCN